MFRDSGPGGVAGTDVEVWMKRAPVGGNAVPAEDETLEAGIEDVSVRGCELEIRTLQVERYDSHTLFPKGK